MANNKFQLKRTSVSGRTPNTTNSSNASFIDAGELAVNLTDKKVYSSNGTASFEVGSNLTNLSVTSSATISNDKQLKFQTVNPATFAFFTQQSDDNFVMYSTNTSGGTRAIWSVFANSITSAFSVSTPTIFNSTVTLGSVAVSANNSTGVAGQVLTTNGSATYWASATAVSVVNVAAQYAWTNTHSFAANVSFTNNISIATNTAIYLNGLADANWRIGRNTGALTKWIYSNNTIDVVTANSTNEGFAVGLVSNATYFETGYLGTYIASNVTIGNSSVSTTINATSFSGAANSSTYANSSVTNTFTVGTASYFVANGNFGVGTNAPNRKLFVAGPVGGTPSLTTSDGEIAFFQSTTTQGISIGADGASPYGSWLQVKRPTNDGNSYPLLLNPVGGNVGIGSTNPTQKLHVQGTAYATSDLRSPIYYDSDNTTYYAELAGSTSLIASGNVSIGTTSPNGKLTVSQSSQSSDSNYQIQYNRLSVANTAVTAGRTKSLFYGLIDNYNQNKSADGLTQYSSISAGAVLYVYNGSSSTGGDANSSLYGTLNYVQNWANGATSNAISIGTGTYNVVAPVRGAITSATGSSNEITQANSSYANIATAIATRSVITGNTTGGSSITTGYLFYGNYYGAQPTTAYGVYITGEQKNYFSANVGIGTTTPNVPLAVNGTIIAANGIGIGYGTAGSTLSAGIGVYLQNNRARIQFTDNTADNTTNVLEFLRGNGTGNWGWLSITADGSNGLKAMAFNLAGADRLKIIANGNIGIGNTAPANKLFVTGDIGLDGISVRDTATSTTTATTQIALFEYPVATYDSCDVVIKAVSGGERHTTKLLVTANSTVAVATEYGTIQTGTSLFTVDVDVTLANTRILITPASTTSTVFKSSYELITS